jgi:hypothetical protein
MKLEVKVGSNGELHIENAKFLRGNYTPTSKFHFRLPTLSFLLHLY